MARIPKTLKTLKYASPSLEIITVAGEEDDLTVLDHETGEVWTLETRGNQITNARLTGTVVAAIPMEELGRS